MRAHTRMCLLTNGSDLTHQDSSGGVSSSALTAPPLRNAAARQKSRRGKVGQADLCSRRVKRSEWAKGTGHVRALLLTAGEEEARWAHGQGPKGANSACCSWKHAYTHIPVLTQGQTPPANEDQDSHFGPTWINHCYFKFQALPVSHHQCITSYLYMKLLTGKIEWGCSNQQTNCSSRWVRKRFQSNFMFYLEHYWSPGKVWDDGDVFFKC